jgi:expansin (peptidoglycan-binding protein)
MVHVMRGKTGLLPVVVLFGTAVACSGDDPEARGGADGGGTTGSGGRPSGARAGSNVATGGAPQSGDGTTYGETVDGGEFHLGPVDYEETEWHNACAPAERYAEVVRQAQGQLLAGLWNGIPDVASYCDACISVTTDRGKSAVLRVVTYGDTSPNSIDVSPAAFDILDSGEYPRAMSWQLVKCPETGKVMYQFQTGSSQWWTSLWVRNARVPLAKVEVKSPNHSSYVELDRGGDGTLTDADGFGEGPFSIRLTGVDGQEVVDEFDWPSGGIAGQMLTGAGNFE